MPTLNDIVNDTPVSNPTKNEAPRRKKSLSLADVAGDTFVAPQEQPIYTPRNVPSSIPLPSDKGMTIDKSGQTSLLPLLTQAREQAEAQKNAGVKAGASKSNATTDAFSGIEKLRNLPAAAADRLALQFGGDSKHPEYTLGNISDGLFGNFEGKPSFLPFDDVITIAASAIKDTNDALEGPSELSHAIAKKFNFQTEGQLATLPPEQQVRMRNRGRNTARVSAEEFAQMGGGLASLVLEMPASGIYNMKEDWQAGHYGRALWRPFDFAVDLGVEMAAGLGRAATSNIDAGAPLTSSLDMAGLIPIAGAASSTLRAGNAAAKTAQVARAAKAAAAAESGALAEFGTHLGGVLEANKAAQAARAGALAEGVTLMDRAKGAGSILGGAYTDVLDDIAQAQGKTGNAIAQNLAKIEQQGLGSRGGIAARGAQKSFTAPTVASIKPQNITNLADKALAVVGTPSRMIGTAAAAGETGMALSDAVGNLRVGDTSLNDIADFALKRKESPYMQGGKVVGPQQELSILTSYSDVTKIPDAFLRQISDVKKGQNLTTWGDQIVEQARRATDNFSAEASYINGVKITGGAKRAARQELRRRQKASQLTLSEQGLGVNIDKIKETLQKAKPSKDELAASAEAVLAQNRISATREFLQAEAARKPEDMIAAALKEQADAYDKATKYAGPTADEMAAKISAQLRDKFDLPESTDAAKAFDSVFTELYQKHRAEMQSIAKEIRDSGAHPDVIKKQLQEAYKQGGLRLVDNIKKEAHKRGIIKTGPSIRQASYVDPDDLIDTQKWTQDIFQNGEANLRAKLQAINDDTGLTTAQKYDAIQAAYIAMNEEVTQAIAMGKNYKAQFATMKQNMQEAKAAYHGGKEKLPAKLYEDEAQFLKQFPEMRARIDDVEHHSGYDPDLSDYGDDLDIERFDGSPQDFYAQKADEVRSQLPTKVKLTEYGYDVDLDASSLPESHPIRRVVDITNDFIAAEKNADFARRIAPNKVMLNIEYERIMSALDEASPDLAHVLRTALDDMHADAIGMGRHDYADFAAEAAADFAAESAVREVLAKGGKPTELVKEQAKAYRKFLSDNKEQMRLLPYGAVRETAQKQIKAAFFGVSDVKQLPRMEGVLGRVLDEHVEKIGTHRTQLLDDTIGVARKMQQDLHTEAKAAFEMTSPIFDEAKKAGRVLKEARDNLKQRTALENAGAGLARELAKDIKQIPYDVSRGVLHAMADDVMRGAYDPQFASFISEIVATSAAKEAVTASAHSHSIVQSILPVLRGVPKEVRTALVRDMYRFVADAVQQGDVPDIAFLRQHVAETVAPYRATSEAIHETASKAVESLSQLYRTAPTREARSALFKNAYMQMRDVLKQGGDADALLRNLEDAARPLAEKRVLRDAAVEAYKEVSPQLKEIFSAIDDYRTRQKLADAFHSEFKNAMREGRRFDPQETVQRAYDEAKEIIAAREANIAKGLDDAVEASDYDKIAKDVIKGTPTTFLSHWFRDFRNKKPTTTEIRTTKMRGMLGLEDTKIATLPDGSEWQYLPKTRYRFGTHNVNAYGALSGKWVPKQIAEALEQSMLFKGTVHAHFLQSWKAGKVAGNIPSHWNQLHDLFIRTVIDGGTPMDLSRAASDLADFANGTVKNRQILDELEIFDSLYGTQLPQATTLQAIKQMPRMVKDAGGILPALQKLAKAGVNFPKTLAKMWIDDFRHYKGEYAQRASDLADATGDMIPPKSRAESIFDAVKGGTKATALQVAKGFRGYTEGILGTGLSTVFAATETTQKFAAFRRRLAKLGLNTPDGLAWLQRQFTVGAVDDAKVADDYARLSLVRNGMIESIRERIKAARLELSDTHTRIKENTQKLYGIKDKASTEYKAIQDAIEVDNLRVKAIETDLERYRSRYSDVPELPKIGAHRQVQADFARNRAQFKEMFDDEMKLFSFEQNDLPHWAEVLKRLPVIGSPFAGYGVVATRFYGRMMLDKPHLYSAGAKILQMQYDASTEQAKEQRDVAPSYMSPLPITDTDIANIKYINPMNMFPLRGTPYMDLDSGGGSIQSQGTVPDWYKAALGPRYGNVGAWEVGRKLNGTIKPTGPFVGVMEALHGKTFYFDKDLYKPTDTDGEKLRKALWHVFSTEGAGVVSNIVDKVIPALLGEEDARRGRKMSPAHALASFFGFKVEPAVVADMKLKINKAKIDADKAVDDWWQSLTDEQRKDPKNKKLYTRRKNSNDEALMRALGAKRR